MSCFSHPYVPEFMYSALQSIRGINPLLPITFKLHGMFEAFLEFAVGHNLILPFSYSLFKDLNLSVNTLTPRLFSTVALLKELCFTQILQRNRSSVIYIMTLHVNYSFTNLMFI